MRLLGDFMFNFEKVKTSVSSNSIAFVLILLFQSMFFRDMFVMLFVINTCVLCLLIGSDFIDVLSDFIDGYRTKPNKQPHSG